MAKTMLEIQEELHAMNEWKVLARIGHFSMSIRLLEKNANELLKFVDFLTNDPRSSHLTSVSKSAQLDLAFEEVIRLLHNFVASASSLVDHTRVFYNEIYEKAGLFPEYQSEVQKRFIDVPLLRFVQNLRQFAQHYRLPNIGFTLDYHHEKGTSRRLYLDKSDLRTFSSWNAPSKSYLDNAPDQIDIHEMVTSYLHAIREFYKWIADRQREIHASDLAAVDAKQAEARREMAKELPTILEAGLSIYNQGVGSLRDVFAVGLSPVDHIELTPYEGDLPEWVRRAIEIIDKKFGPLPEKFLKSIQSLLKSGESTDRFNSKDANRKNAKNKEKRLRQKAARKKNRGK